MVIVVGKIVVPVAGTPVRLTDAVIYQQALEAAGLSQLFKTVQAVLFQAWKGNTGQIYIGNNLITKASGVGVAAVLVIPTATAIASFGAANQMSPAGIDTSAFYLDADVSGEGVVVTVLMS